MNKSTTITGSTPSLGIREAIAKLACVLNEEKRSIKLNLREAYSEIRNAIDLLEDVNHDVKVMEGDKQQCT